MYTALICNKVLICPFIYSCPNTFIVSSCINWSPYYMADVDTDTASTPDTEVISDGYFHESEYRSAPYFDITIDGITQLNTKF